ncbi:MAG: type II toxin-antitoxin system Phd/YefM family antitoxin [Actinobacteria bacterium]|nr:MAG: type II toxin-antitoxin system Phd/YefM family antitoxin [Actinomycetota bacterium]
MTEYRTVTDAKAHLNELVDQVVETDQHVVLTRHGLPAAILMSFDEHEGLLETIDILRTPGALDEIREAQARIDAGEFDTLEELKADIARRVPEAGVDE